MTGKLKRFSDICFLAFSGLKACDSVSRGNGILIKTMSRQKHEFLESVSIFWNCPRQSVMRNPIIGCLIFVDIKKLRGGGGGEATFLSCLNFFFLWICRAIIFFLWFVNLFSYVARSCSNFFPLDFRLTDFFFFLLWAHPPHHFSKSNSYYNQLVGLVCGHRWFGWGPRPQIWLRPAGLRP